MEKVMTIKKIAQYAGVGIETIRFYEREELIPEPPRTPAGYRQYTPEAVSRLKFIKRAQALGFTLPEIKELLSLKASRCTRPEVIRNKAKKKIADIKFKIQNLQRIRETLEKITESCHRKNASLNECPILKAFEDDCCTGKE